MPVERKRIHVDLASEGKMNEEKPSKGKLNGGIPADGQWNVDTSPNILGSMIFFL